MSRNPSKNSHKHGKWRQYLRSIHRDLSYFFSGVIIIYALSGLFLNHKNDFNPSYTIKQYAFKIPMQNYPIVPSYFTKEEVIKLLEPYGESNNYTKHYFPDKEKRMKVFLRGGSSMEVDLTNGNAMYEEVRKRPVISSFNRLHYNPSKWWTIFSDIFIVSLIIITLTGILMNKGKKGIWGRGGIELIIGIIIPLLFMLIS